MDPAEIGRFHLHEVGRARVDERLYVGQGVTPLVGDDRDVDASVPEAVAEFDHRLYLSLAAPSVHRPSICIENGAAASSMA